MIQSFVQINTYYTVNFEKFQYCFSLHILIIKYVFVIQNQTNI